MSLGMGRGCNLTWSGMKRLVMGPGVWRMQELRMPYPARDHLFGGNKILIQGEVAASLWRKGKAGITCISRRALPLIRSTVPGILPG